MVEVSEMERAVAFYRDVLGFSIGFTSQHWTSMQVGAASLGLHAMMRAPGPSVGGWVLGYSVKDIQALRARLLLADVKLVQDLHDVPGGVVLLFLDPDGNSLQAIQRGVTRESLGV